MQYTMTFTRPGDGLIKAQRHITLPMSLDAYYANDDYVSAVSLEEFFPEISRILKEESGEEFFQDGEYFPAIIRDASGRNDTPGMFEGVLWNDYTVTIEQGHFATKEG